MVRRLSMIHQLVATFQMPLGGGVQVQLDPAVISLQGSAREHLAAKSHLSPWDARGWATLDDELTRQAA
jgi:hypothetical protein